MKLGISTYTFTWAIGVQGHMPEKPLSIYGLIDKAAAYKVDCVQVADNLPLHLFDSTELQSIKRHADNLNIQIEVGTRGLTVSHILQYLKIAKLFESPFLRVVIDAKDYHPSLPDIIKVLRELVPVFEKEKVILSIENHDRLLAEEFNHIIHTVDSEYLGICLDSVNSMGAGEGFRQVANMLIPYTVNLHIKDFSIKRVFHMMGLEILGTPAGKGMMNIPEVLTQLAKYRKCQSATLELWTPQQATIQETVMLEQQWADESISYLKNTIYKYS